MFYINIWNKMQLIDNISPEFCPGFSKFGSVDPLFIKGWHDKVTEK